MKMISKLFLFSLVLCHSHLSLGQTDATLPSTPSCTGPFRYNGYDHDIDIRGTLIVAASAGTLNLSTYPPTEPADNWLFKPWKFNKAFDSACGGTGSSEKSLEVPCESPFNDCANADALTFAKHKFNANCDSISIKLEPEISFNFKGEALVNPACCGGDPSLSNNAAASGSGEHIMSGGEEKNRIISNVVFTIPNTAHKVLINGVATLSCPSNNSFTGTMYNYLEILTDSGWILYSSENEGNWSYLFLHWSWDPYFTEIDVNSVNKPFNSCSMSRVLIPGTYRLRSGLLASGDASVIANCATPSPDPMNVSGAIKGSVKITAQQIFQY